MNRAIRMVLVAVLMVAGALMSTGLARADVSDSSGSNVQDGSNRSTGTQSGSSKTGDAVGGQVTGVVSSGRTSVDARNNSSNSDVTSGDADGSNSANTFTGQNVSPTIEVGGSTADLTGVSALNAQDGNNTSTYSQSANYTTGDGVAGEVIGVVTAAGGSASIVAANTSNDVSVQTGDADGSNDLAAFTGQNFSEATTTVGGGDALANDVEDSCNSANRSLPFPAGCANAQDGNNRSTLRQSSNASTGDGVAGQVIGAVSAGATSIDASNRSDGVDVETGDASSENSLGAFTGQNATFGTLTVTPADVQDSCNALVGCGNVQDGNNTTTLSQRAVSTTGDGVGGEVIGVVTSAGGSASVVASNVSTNSDITTGDADSSNDLASFVGQNVAGTTTVSAADLTNVCGFFGCGNAQDGSNRLSGSQSAVSATGDGVGGQVLGVVSAGAASVDASNHTDDSSVETGDSDATNAAAEFVGLNTSGTTTVGGPGISDVDSVTAANVQDGGNRKTLNQTANATSGDAVAGQVGGVVTSAGGSASVVLANTSTSIDSLSGDTNFDNSDSGFVGQSTTSFALTIL